MLDDIKKELAQRDCLSPFNEQDWLNYAQISNSLTADLKPSFIKIIATHTGVSQPELKSFLEAQADEQPAFIAQLIEKEQTATDKLHIFKSKPLFNNIKNIELLAVSRAEWLAIMTRLEQKKVLRLLHLHFFDSLAAIRKVDVDSLLNLMRREQPARTLAPRMQAPVKQSRKRARFAFFAEDQGDNHLIAATPNTELQTALEATGVRNTRLEMASPEKGYAKLMRTPNGRKVRPVCDINGVELFKHVTPYSKAARTERVDVRNVSEQTIAAELPRLQTQRAEPVEFTATLATLQARSGLRRPASQCSIMGASVNDVFRAHGIEISYEHQNSQHWAHLLAHCLCDSNQIISERDETINLVPSTAAANYNTLKVVELFVKNKLESEDSEEIHIHVAPHYSGESLIPDLLVYTLKWKEMNAGQQQEFNEKFYINPQSYERISQRMQQSIETLRQAGKTSPIPFNLAVADSVDDNDNAMPSLPTGPGLF